MTSRNGGREEARPQGAKAKLRPFLRPSLDVLFVALNPPSQSNANEHYFSGKQSRFFELLFKSGLIARRVPKLRGDEIVFGSNAVNYNGAQFGVVDLVEEVVQTKSRNVRVSADHVSRLLNRIRESEPRFVCLIHADVRKALIRHGQLTAPLEYGCCGPLVKDCPSRFVLNWFPNGNAISDQDKIRVFRELRDLL
jgi:G:T/U-mismatch repair DNA glycosylase